ncbi:hypothetical protein CCHR01_15649 [Colletotrichum chrysophilum]|uniref:Uncharacterized protein n=1 Tax=Colletotrichum chrysophilum TaxID=1836956 RepID=A0AAD9A5A9_9PEZI|nr:hypothetical protein CCHR01_15649 [Colletotrichum chrysophilum]
MQAALLARMRKSKTPHLLPQVTDPCCSLLRPSSTPSRVHPIRPTAVPSVHPPGFCPGPPVTFSTSEPTAPFGKSPGRNPGNDHVRPLAWENIHKDKHLPDNQTLEELVSSE